MGIDSSASAGKVVLAVGLSAFVAGAAKATTYTDPVEITDTVQIADVTYYNNQVSGAGGFHVLSGGNLTLNYGTNTFSGNVEVDAGGFFTTINQLNNKATVAGLGSVYLHCDAPNEHCCCWTFSSQMPKSTSLFIDGVSSAKYPATNQGGGTVLNGLATLADEAHWYIGSSGYDGRDDGAEGTAKIQFLGGVNGPNAGIEFAAHTVINFGGVVKARSITAGYRVGSRSAQKGGMMGGFQLAKADNEIGSISLDHQKLWCLANGAVNGAALTFFGGDHTSVTNFYTSSGKIYALETSYVDLNRNASGTYTQTFKWIETDVANDPWQGEASKGWEIRNRSSANGTLKLSGEADKTATCEVAVNENVDILIDAPATFKQVFANRTSLTSGKITVASGTFETSGTAAFPNVKSVEVGANGVFQTAAGAAWPIAGELDSLVLSSGARFALPEGVTLRVKALTVDGQKWPLGDYPASAARPAEITGGGTLVVTESAPVEGLQTVWTGGGSDESVLTAANWEEDVTGFLSFEKVIGVFASGGVRATVPGKVIFNGLKLDLAAGQGTFTLTPDQDAGDSLIRLGLAGITNSSTAAIASCPAADVNQMLSIEAPLEVAADQAWNLRTNLGLRVVGGLAGSRKVTVNGGYLELADATDYEGNLTIKCNETFIHGEIGKADGAGALTLTLNDNEQVDKKYGFVTFSNAVVNTTVKIDHSGGGMANYNSMIRYTSTTAPVTNVFNGEVKAQNSTTFYLGGNSTAVFNGGLTGGNNIILRNAANNARFPAVFVFNAPVSTSGSTTKSYITFQTPGTIADFNATNNYAQVGLRGAAAGIARFGVNDAFRETCFYMSDASTTATLDLGRTHQNFTYFSGTSGTTVTGDIGSAVCVKWGIKGAQPEAIASQCTFAGGSILGHVSWEASLASDDRVFRFDNITSRSHGDVSVSRGTLEFTSTASWPLGTNVTVSGTGKLKVGSGGTFGKQTVLRFSDGGTFEMPTGAWQRVSECWVGDTKVEPGVYVASDLKAGDPLYGHLNGGTLRVGRFGLMLLVR